MIDLNGMNHYPARSPEFILDYYRAARGTILPVEQFTRLLRVDTGPGWMRLWAYMAIAHGSCGVNFFRWRCCRWGQEQHRDGILPHDGQPARRYEELVRMGAEIARVGERIDRTRPQSEVAILMSYEARWAIEAGTGRPRVGSRRGCNCRSRYAARSERAHRCPGPARGPVRLSSGLCPAPVLHRSADRRQPARLCGKWRHTLPDRAQRCGRCIQREF